MNLELIGFTIETLGTIMIAYTVISVHHKVWKERKIDEQFFSAMKTEQIITVIGVIFIVLGYFLQLSAKI